MTIEILPLFATPVQIGKLNRQFSSEEIEFFNSLDKSKNETNLSSKNEYVLDDEKLNKLREDILEHINYYFYEVLKHDKEVEIYITQSWMNYTNENESHHKHFHGNSIISGVVYIDVNNEKDNITFYNDEKEQIIIKKTEWNIFNAKKWTVPVEKERILMFPSALLHSVETKIGAGTRVSLSFNTFVKGNLCGEKGANRLVL